MKKQRSTKSAGASIKKLKKAMGFLGIKRIASLSEAEQVLEENEILFSER